MPVNAENFVKLELAQGICLRLGETFILQTSVNFQFWGLKPLSYTDGVKFGVEELNCIEFVSYERLCPMFITRHRASTSMYSLKFRVRAMLP